MPTVHEFFEELGIAAEIFSEYLMVADALVSISITLSSKLLDIPTELSFSQATSYSRLALLRLAVDIEPYFIYGSRMPHANFFCWLNRCKLHVE